MSRLAIFLLAISGALSAQPRTIVFSRAGPSQVALYVSKADGSEERPLLKSSTFDYDPAWSPDGQWIVFTSERDGPASLYRVKPDGTGLERLTESLAYDDQAAFSPDGQQIVFVSSRAEGTAALWILDLPTRKARPLTSGPGGDFRPAWSPDGKWIAFSSDRGSTLPRDNGGKWWVRLHIVDLYLIRPDGSGLKRLTKDHNFCGGPRWTRDSRRLIAYCMSAEDTFTFRTPPNLTNYENVQRGRAPLRGDTQLVSIDIATGEKTKIAPGPGIKIFPSVLPSGEIAYVRKDAGGPGIFYTNGKSGPRGAVRSPSWSPDGTQVAYHKVLSQQLPSWQKTWSRNPNYELVLTRLLPAFHPSGEYLVATQDGDNSKMVLIETGQNTSRTLFQHEGKLAFAPQWSPQGDAIIFGLGQYFRNRAQGAQVALIKPDGSGFRELTSGPNNNGFPSFSPDGERFVYRTFGPEGQGLRIMNLENSEVTALTREYDNFPLWSPRGDLIIFVRQDQTDFQIFSIRSDGTDLKQLTNSPGNNAHMAWSPDGEWIAFSSSRMGFKDEVLNTDSAQPYGELFVMRYDGTQVQQLTDNQWEDGGPAWLPSANDRALLEPACAVTSPERRGEIGCSLVEDKPLPETLKEPLFWHIDRFDSGERARAAVGPTSIAFEAHGTWWLMTIESKVDDHYGGQHVTQVGLPPLPKAAKYSMLAMSAYIPAGLTSRVHHHSGVEGFYVVDGEQCLETPERSYKMLKGDTLIIPAGVTMQLVATGSAPRRALAVIVYDASQPPTTRMENGPQLVSCK